MFFRKILLKKIENISLKFLLTNTQIGVEILMIITPLRSNNQKRT
jgi:hypothetical protein